MPPIPDATDTDSHVQRVIHANYFENSCEQLLGRVCFRKKFYHFISRFHALSVYGASMKNMDLYDVRSRIKFVRLRTIVPRA